MPWIGENVIAKVEKCFSALTYILRHGHKVRRVTKRMVIWRGMYLQGRDNLLANSIASVLEVVVKFTARILCIIDINVPFTASSPPRPPLVSNS